MPKPITAPSNSTASFYTVRVTPAGCESPLNDSINFTFTDSVEAGAFGARAILAGHKVRDWNGALFATADAAMNELEFGLADVSTSGARK